MIAETLFGGRRHLATDRGPTSDFWYSRIFGGSTSSNVNVNEDTALTYSAVWAATRLLAGTAGMLPVNLYKRRAGGEGQDIQRQDKRHQLVHTRPNTEMSAMMFRSSQVGYQINGGNCYSEIQRVGNMPTALWPIHPSRVTFRRAEDGSIIYVVRNNGGAEPTLIPAKDMLHVPSMMSDDGIIGKGVIQHARESIGFGLATERYGASWFGGGGIPRLIVKHPGQLGEDARTNFRKEWGQMLGSPDSQKLALLSEGADVVPLSISAQDSQFLETREHNLTEISRWYGVPPHLLYDLRRATFCLPGDAVVFTVSGPKKIEDVVTGEIVWSRSDESTWVKSRVDASSCTGTDTVLQIRAGIRTLRCNTNHRVPVRRKVLRPYTGGRGRSVIVNGEKMRTEYAVEWVDAGEIVVGDQLLAAHGFGEEGMRSCPTRDDCTTEFMESLGMIIGDGFFARTHKNGKAYKTSFGISHGENDSYLPHYVSAIESEFRACDGPYGLRNGGTATLTAKRRDKNTTMFYSSLAYKELDELGIAGTAKTKRVPEWVFGMAEDLKLAFLRGYLDADGTVIKSGQIRYVSVNRELLEDVRHLCMSVGVRVGNMGSSEIDSTFGDREYHHTLHRFVVTSPQDCERIGTHTDFYKPRMAEATARVTGRRTCKVYPCEARRRATEPGVVYTTVEEITAEPVAVPVYDLTVSGTHTFVADGVLVHNSNIESQGIEFVTYSLNPWLKLWEQELAAKLLTDAEQADWFFEFNVNALLRGDAAARAAFYQSLLTLGVISPNEVRELENFNPFEGGDTHFIQGAMVPVEDAAEPDEPEPSPAPPVIPEPKDDGLRAMIADVRLESECMIATLRRDIVTALKQQPVVEEPRRIEDDREEKLSTAAKTMLTAATGRMVRKHATAARKASDKPGEFLNWMDTFEEKNSESFTKEVQPAVDALVVLGHTVDAGEIVTRHMAAARDDLLTATEVKVDEFAESIRLCVSSWEETRAVELSDQVFTITQ